MTARQHLHFRIMSMGILVIAFAGQMTNSTLHAESDITFTYEAITGETGSSGIWGTVDSVNFEFYYVEQSCGPYNYRLRNVKDSLIIEHVFDNPDSCTEDETLYSVLGTITGLQPGKYIVLFQVVADTTPTVLLQDAFILK